MVEGVSAGFSNRTVLMLSAAGAIQFAAWAPYWLEWPILFNQSYGVGVWIIGWIYCGLSIARMIGAEVSSRIAGDETSRRGARQRVDAMAGVYAVRRPGCCSGRPGIALAMLFVMNLCHRRGGAAAAELVQRAARISHRATLLSFSSTFETMGGSIGLFAGFIADTRGNAVRSGRLGGADYAAGDAGLLGDRAPRSCAAVEMAEPVAK